MSDVIGNVFEVSQNSNGPAAIGAWIAAQVAGSAATHIIATTEYNQGTLSYVVVLMATTLAVNPTSAIGAYAASATFDIRNGIAPVLAWLNAQGAGVLAPAAPGLSLLSAGTLTGQGTMYAKVTLVTPTGETAASTEASLAVTDDHELVVAAPAFDANHTATGWNVYIGSASGGEKKQNTSPIAMGTNYTVAAAIGTTGATAPATNATAATTLRHAGLTERFKEKLFTVVVSN